MAKPLAKLIALLTPKRRWAQFSLGTMFIIMTVLCVWLAVQVNRAHRQRDALAAIVAHHGRVKTYSVGPGWLPKWLGPEYTTRVTTVDFAMNGGVRIAKQIPYVTDADLIHLARLPEVCVLELGNNPALTDDGLIYLKNLSNLTTLYCYRSAVKGPGLANLSGLRQLTGLQLSYSPINDDGLVHVENMTQMMFLSLDDTKVTDVGLAHLLKLANIESLNLRGTKVTDAGLKNLVRMKKAKQITLTGTLVTDAGAAELQKRTDEYCRQSVWVTG